MGPNNKALKGTFQPRNGLKPTGGIARRIGETAGNFSHSVARFLRAAKDDSDEMSTHRTPDIVSTQKPHRNGLMSQMASSSGPGSKRRQSPEVDELVEEESFHPKRQRHSQDPRKSPRIDVAALETMRAKATENGDADEVQKITDQLEGKTLSSRAYQNTQKHAIEPVDSDDELNATPQAREVRSSGGIRTSVKGQGSPLSHKASKGDMRKTKFKGKQDFEITLSRAVSGKEYFDAADNTEIIRLRLLEEGTFSLTPITKSGEKIEGCPWLNLILKECHKVGFSPDSPHILFERPAKREASAQLLLEIPSITDVCATIAWLRNGKETQKLKTLNFIDLGREKLKRIFDNQYHTATVSTSPDQHRRRQLEAYSPNSAETSVQQDISRGLDPRLCRQPKPSSPPLGPTTGPAGHISLKDRMKGSTSSSPSANTPRSSADAPRSSRLERRTRFRLETPPLLAPTPKRWVDEHPEWAKIWDNEPLIYPANGKNRAQITKDDILRLEEGECLNDNIIVFYLRYLQSRLERDSVGWSERILFMNPWFYERLSQRKSRGVDYDAVKSWTAKVDLLSKDYIIVPVNEAAHWYLAIICNPGKLLPVTETEKDATTPTDTEEELVTGEQKSPADSNLDVEENSGDEVRVVSDIVQNSSSRASKTSSSTKKEPNRKPDGTAHRSSNPGDARVITLDSLGSTHSPTCTNLRDYLVQEIKHRRNIDIETPVRFGLTAKGIPAQDDYTSCGVYLLAYVERFLKQPDQVISEIVSKSDLGWSDINPVAMRGEIRQLIIDLRQEQNAQRDKEKKAKKEAKAAKLAQKKQDARSVVSPAATTPQTSGTIDPSETVQGFEPSHSDPPSSGKAIVLSASDPEDTGQLPIDRNTACSIESIQPPAESVESPNPGSPTIHAVEPLMDSSEIEEAVAGYGKSLLSPIRSSTPLIPKTPKRKRSVDEIFWSAEQGNVVRGGGRPEHAPTDEKGQHAAEPGMLSYLSSPSGASAGRHPKKVKTNGNDIGDEPVTVIIDDSPKNQKISEERTTSRHFAAQPVVRNRRPYRAQAFPDQLPSNDKKETTIIYGGTARRPPNGSRAGQARPRLGGKSSIIVVDGKNIDLTTED